MAARRKLTSLTLSPFCVLEETPQGTEVFILILGVLNGSNGVSEYVECVCLGYLWCVLLTRIPTPIFKAHRAPEIYISPN